MASQQNTAIGFSGRRVWILLRGRTGVLYWARPAEAKRHNSF